MVLKIVPVSISVLRNHKTISISTKNEPPRTHQENRLKVPPSFLSQKANINTNFWHLGAPPSRWFVSIPDAIFGKLTVN